MQNNISEKDKKALLWIMAVFIFIIAPLGMMFALTVGDGKSLSDPKVIKYIIYSQIPLTVIFLVSFIQYKFRNKIKSN
ncbi:MAG: hypothetical protein ACOCXG_03615 [Nanoarchaeota archaeon]